MIDIRPATDADRPQVIARLAEVFGPAPAARVDRLWDWQWHQDPRLPAPGYRGIVADWRGEVIGTMGTIPAGLHVRGRPVTAWWCVDCLVNPALTRQALAEQRASGAPAPDHLARGIGAALLDHPAAGPIQLVKHISDSGMKLLERTRFSAVEDSSTLHRRVSLRHTLGRALGRVLGDGLGYILDLAMPLGAGPGLPLEPLAGDFDARFDRLWEEVRGLYPAIGRRDAATLNWRYRRHPEGGYEVLTTGEGTRLRGYLVMQVYDRGRRRWAKIVDLVAQPRDAGARRTLLTGALQRLRGQRAERVETFACGAGLAGELAAIGFKPRLGRSGGAQPLMVRALPPAAAGIFATQGDGDGG